MPALRGHHHRVSFSLMSLVSVAMGFTWLWTAQLWNRSLVLLVSEVTDSRAFKADLKMKGKKMFRGLASMFDKCSPLLLFASVLWVSLVWRCIFCSGLVGDWGLWLTQVSSH